MNNTSICLALIALVNTTCTSGFAPDASIDAPSASRATPDGGVVERLRFGVFGDVRPPNHDDTGAYPSAIVTAVMSNMRDLGAQFAVASGDYVFAYSPEAVSAQLALLEQAERAFDGPVFHALGNHDCDTATAGNCPRENETANVRLFRERLAPAFDHVYFDWTVRTAIGDAHFIATAPNAWSSAQAAWLSDRLRVQARYTFVVAHEPPSSTHGPGSVAIERAVAARVPAVTLRIYGHSHEYRHLGGNALISGNAGAPLNGSATHHGFVIVEQNPAGDLVVTAYEIGRPPVAVDSFVVRGDG